MQINSVILYYMTCMTCFIKKRTYSIKIENDFQGCMTIQQTYFFTIQKILYRGLPLSAFTES
jgi:hypothetical protein